MSSDHHANAVTSAVVDVLEGAGLLVGDGEKPAGGGWQGTPGQSAFHPYTVVYNLVGGHTTGTIVDIDADAHPTYQLTSIGATRAQCEAQADLARVAFLAADWQIAGRKVILATVDMLGGATRDDDEQPAIFWSPDRYRLMIVPDTGTAAS